VKSQKLKQDLEIYSKKRGARDARGLFTQAIVEGDKQDDS